MTNHAEKNEMTGQHVKALDEVMRGTEAAKRIFLRDQFAAAALTGLSACHDSAGMWSWTPDSAAGTAYLIADAMLKARGSQ